MRILQRAGASRLYLTGKCREFHQSNHSPRFDRRLTVPRDFTHLDDQGIVSPPNAYEAIHVICRHAGHPALSVRLRFSMGGLGIFVLRRKAIRNRDLSR